MLLWSFAESHLPRTHCDEDYAVFLLYSAAIYIYNCHKGTAFNFICQLWQLHIIISFHRWSGEVLSMVINLGIGMFFSSFFSLPTFSGRLKLTLCCRLDLYLPENINSPKPVVAFVTGGAWIIGLVRKLDTSPFFRFKP